MVGTTIHCPLGASYVENSLTKTYLQYDAELEIVAKVVSELPHGGQILSPDGTYIPGEFGILQCAAENYNKSIVVLSFISGCSA